MRRGNRNRGQVLVVFVGALTALIGFAAVGIDVGYLYTVRHELQRCADAGALAGASAFLNGDWNDSGIRYTATTRAQQFASMDRVASATLNPDGGEVTVGFPATGQVQVNANRTVNLFFARFFLGPTWNITAFSVAQASVANQNVRGLKPWAIPYPWDDVNGNGLYDPGETVHTDCPDEIVGTPAASQYFCPGTRVILKIGTPAGNPNNPSGIPSVQQEAGHYFALDYGASGAAGYRDAIQTDSTYAVSVGDSVPLETGNMVGPTIQGAEYLINQDRNAVWNDSANLPDSPLAQYSITCADGSASDAWMSSPRVVRIPIYDPAHAPEMGKSAITVAGFAGFWIESVDHHLGTVIGRFIKSKALGSPGTVTGTPTGPTLMVLRLVQ